MMRSKLSVLLAGLALLSLTACTEEVTKQATDAATSASDKATETVDKAKDTATQGVDKAKETTEQATSEVNKAVEQGKSAVGDVMALKDSVMGMKDGATQTLTAVKAGDFTKAKEEFEKLKTSWSGIEGTVKTKSADSYTTIEENIKKVDGLLKAEKPDQAQITTAIESLTKGLTGVIPQ